MRNEKILIGMILVVVLLGFVSADTYSSSNVASSPFSGGSYTYLKNQGIDIAPIFSEGDCQAGQDFILQIAPEGCSPKVVRSDLLEEQNVPVFCPIVATKINPLIDVEAIESMSFSGQYPPQVSGVGFHPAQAALGSSASLSNTPLLENVGYAVIVLKKQSNESAMPEFVKGNLTAKIRYDINNAFGVGETGYVVQQVDDAEWDNIYKKYSFWNGKGFLRAEEVSEEGARISIYGDKDSVLGSFFLNAGDTSSEIYVPGYYCRVGLSVKLKEIINPDTRVRLSVDEDVIEKLVGEKFLDNRCTVNSIEKQGLVKSAVVFCRGDEKSQRFVFSISPKVDFNVDEISKSVVIGGKIKDNYYLVSLESSGDESKSANLVAWVLQKTGTAKELSGTEITANYERIKRIGEGEKIPAELKKIEFGKTEFGITLKGFAEPEDSWGDAIAEQEKQFYVVEYQGDFVLYKDGEVVKDSEGNILGAESLEGLNSILFDLSGEKSFRGEDLPLSVGIEEDTIDIKSRFNSAISTYKELTTSYPFVTQRDANGADIDGIETYSEEGLRRGIMLANFVGMYSVKDELIRMLVEKYPSKPNKLFAEQMSDSYKGSNTGSTSASILVNGKYRTISFEDVYEPSLEEYGVEVLVVDGKTSDFYNLQKNRVQKIGDNFIELKNLAETYAEFSTNIGTTDEATVTTRVNLKDTLTGTGGISVRLNKIYLKKAASVEVIPNINNAGTEANLQFNIGIEKRNIELSPEKIKSLINSLNKTIEDWQGKSDSLGKVVKVMNGACLAAGTLLTVKNLFFGLDGDAIARDYTMNGVDGKGGIVEYCSGQTQFINLQKCLDDSKTRARYNKDFDMYSGLIETQNTQLEAIRRNNIKKSGFLEDVVDNEGFREDYGPQVEKEIYGAKAEGQLSEANTLELRRLQLYKGMMKADASYAKDYNSLLETITDRKVALTEIENSAKSKNIRSADITIIGDANTQPGVYKGQVWKDIDRSAVGGVTAPKEVDTPVQFILANGGDYFAILKEGDGRYGITELYKKEGGTYKSVEAKTLNVIFKKADSYNVPTNSKSAMVTFFGSAPNKGTPATVPFEFNIKTGWYAAVRNEVGVVEDSKAIRKFYVCNSGDDGVIDFDPDTFSVGEDDCIQEQDISRGATQFGLNPTQTQQLFDTALRAYKDASKYTEGDNSVNVLGKDYLVGNPAANVPSLQCENFMPYDECTLLYNLCDPVVCPTSRCNLGGTTYVTDVVQSGIIGSIFLCLPNSVFFGGRVVIPICLTGLKAGIDALLSVFKDYRDCLQEKLDTGRTIGVCDEIYSIHLCEFFWRQFSPFIDVIIPRMLQFFSGQSVRGGGEYQTVLAAWKNAQNSMEYFTKQYAVQSFASFKSDSYEAIGSAVCKNFVSTGVDIDFLDDLTDPRSPPQFHGRFDEILYTTATVPPISQYSVFYTIFAGNGEDGVYYKVYLKSPSGTSGYSDIPTINVANGFLPAGESVSEKKDFTSPAGYKQMCIMVNEQEECGFDLVSTSFAVDYVRDQVVASEAEKTDITSESECNSGGRNLGSLINPNLQEGVDEFINPDLESKGIVRICASGNPGQGVDTDRWKEVGYCDDTTVKCWLDVRSVKEALELGVVETGTLAEIEYNSALLSGKDYMSMADYNSKVKGFKNLLKDGENLESVLSGVDAILENDKTKFDYQLAELVFLKARVYDELTRQARGDVDVKKPETKKEEEVTEVEAGKDDGEEEAEATNEISNLNVYSGDISQTSLGSNEFSLTRSDRINLKVIHSCENEARVYLERNIFWDKKICESTKDSFNCLLNDALEYGKNVVSVYCVKKGILGITSKIDDSKKSVTIIIAQELSTTST